MRATPSLASESAELILRIGDRRLEGIFHACGGEPATRRKLALLTCEVFGLDVGLLRFAAPPTGALPDAPIPYDTSITMPRTAELLGHEPTPLRRLLERFREEYEAAA